MHEKIWVVESSLYKSVELKIKELPCFSEINGQLWVCWMIAIEELDRLLWSLRWRMKMEDVGKCYFDGFETNEPNLNLKVNLGG